MWVDLIKSLTTQSDIDKVQFPSADFPVDRWRTGVFQQAAVATPASRLLVLLFTVVRRHKLQSTTRLLVVPKPTYVLLCRVGNCLATCFCLFIWFSDFFLFHICPRLSAFLHHSETHAGTSSKWKHIFESVTWRYRVNLVSSLFPSERRLICTTNTLHVSTWALMVHQAISKPSESAPSWATNQASCAP